MENSETTIAADGGRSPILVPPNTKAEAAFEPSLTLGSTTLMTLDEVDEDLARHIVDRVLKRASPELADCIINTRNCSDRPNKIILKNLSTWLKAMQNERDAS
jgi:hypothetical protein